MNDVSTLHSIWKSTWKSVRAYLVIGGVQVIGCLLLVLAKRQGLIDGEGVMRGALVLIGLGLAASGNMIPKMMDGQQPHTLALAALRQKIMRIAGWALMLGGLAFAGLWAFAPTDVAQVWAMVALGVSLAVMIGFVVRWIFAFHHTHER